ncbi:hypothetical protein, partial [Cytobacillus firmus]|uniref:hypothetical protein n=1 Tax=Cytobacillus firmus TaxID=1399 RepID=UPI001C2ECB27
LSKEYYERRRRLISFDRRWRADHSNLLGLEERIETAEKLGAEARNYKKRDVLCSISFEGLILKLSY